MAEESAVNYWEVCRNTINPSTWRALNIATWLAQKYADVAFNVNQKAVLTTCVLRTKPRITSGGISDDTDFQDEELSVSCCFSFTIRRDAWGTPSMIVGNFIKC
jgi:hypothetical protein